MAGPDWKLEAEHLARKNKQLRAALEEAQQWLVGIMDPDGLSPEDRECLERIDAALAEDAA